MKVKKYINGLLVKPTHFKEAKEELQKVGLYNDLYNFGPDLPSGIIYNNPREEKKTYGNYEFRFVYLKNIEHPIAFYSPRC